MITSGLNDVVAEIVLDEDAVVDDVVGATVNGVVGMAEDAVDALLGAAADAEIDELLADVDAVDEDAEEVEAFFDENGVPKRGRDEEVFLGVDRIGVRESASCLLMGVTELES